MHSKSLHMVAFILLAVGGLNWLLIGLLDMNVIMKVLGSGSILERAAYTFIGLSAVYELITHKAACAHCSPKKDGDASGGGSAPMGQV